MVTPSTQASGSKQVWDPQPHERQETLLINCLYTVFCAPNETAFSKADVKNGILETLVVNSVPNWNKKKKTKSTRSNDYQNRFMWFSLGFVFCFLTHKLVLFSIKGRGSEMNGNVCTA